MHHHRKRKRKRKLKLKLERKISPYIDNPDKHLKSFDIIKRAIKDSDYYHFAIYLGKGQVVHVYDPEEGSSSSSSSNNKVRRDS